MAFVELVSSPLAPAASPVRIHYRESGAGQPLVILHGGWGYGIYPFDRQIAALSRDHRIVVPDRTGYGQSGRLVRQETDFHHRAAAETRTVIDALELERPILWGHSDGAIIAILIGLSAPDRIGGIIAEATHFFLQKPASREFFETMMHNPDGLGERVAAVLAREHGTAWRDLIRTNGDAWLRIAETASGSGADLYGGRLTDLRVPLLLIHGARDPRTEPGELDALRSAVPAARVAVLAEGGHSPHSERTTADETTRIAADFVASLREARETAGDPRSPAANAEGPRR